MAVRDVVVVGTSAGGVQALLAMVRALPRGFRGRMVVVMHVPPTARSLLPEILDGVGGVRAQQATDGALLDFGVVLVAPPDHHVLLHRDRVRLTRGPRENGHRPAIDPLFRSAARWFGPQVVGVILSGGADDGTSGMYAIKSRGGIALVQAPDDAVNPSMPRSVIDRVGADWVGGAAELGAKLVAVVGVPVAPAPPEAPPTGERETYDVDMATSAEKVPSGPPSAFTCPDCHGPLWELRDGQLARYRCRIGHAFAPESLSAAQAQQIEAALWAALRALEERKAFMSNLAAGARSRGFEDVALCYEDDERAASLRAEAIRSALAIDPGDKEEESKKHA
jgi:two-component system chemotaxis response regulator CheB